MSEPMRLHLGCGPVRPALWTNVDPMPEGDTAGVVIARPESTGLPFIDGMFDGAVAHHVLQMLAWPEIVPWLTEVRRVMKPGAVLRVSVPDLVGAFDAYDENNADWFPIADGIEESLDGKFCVYLSQAGATRSVFTVPWLMELFSRGGFTPIDSPYDRLGETNGPPWLCDLDSRPDESIIVEGFA